MFSVTCGNCGKKYTVKEENRGKTSACKCGQPLELIEVTKPSEIVPAKTPVSDSEAVSVPAKTKTSVSDSDVVSVMLQICGYLIAGLSANAAMLFLSSPAALVIPLASAVGGLCIVALGLILKSVVKIQKALEK